MQISGYIHVYLNFRLLYSSEKDSKVKIVAVDLQQMAPLPGVVQIQGDITKVGVGSIEQD